MHLCRVDTDAGIELHRFFRIRSFTLCNYILQTETESALATVLPVPQSKCIKMRKMYTQLSIKM